MRALLAAVVLLASLSLLARADDDDDRACPSPCAPCPTVTVQCPPGPQVLRAQPPRYQRRYHAVVQWQLVTVPTP